MERNYKCTAVVFLVMLALGVFSLWRSLLPAGVGCGGLRFPSREGYASHLAAGEARTFDAALAGRGEPVQAAPLLQQVEDFVDGAEPALHAALDRDHQLVQVYGGVQWLAGRTYVEDPANEEYGVAKLPGGSLTFLNQEEAEEDVSDNAKQLLRLRDMLELRDIPLLYLQAPQKVAPDGDIPPGTENYGNDYADQLLSILEEEDVSFLDFRTLFQEQDAPWSSWFFRTDHHWTPQAAFLAHQALTAHLREEYGFDIPEKCDDPEQFSQETYADAFLGSQGKRVGTLYGGVDDFTVITPDFPTRFTYDINNGQQVRSGRFASSLLFPEQLAEIDYYNGNPYTFYSGGDFGFTRITNHSNPDGPRVLLIRDSFGCALAPFLALDCSELITVDLRSFYGPVGAYVDALEPDLVLVLYTAGSCRAPELFDFFRTSGTDITYDAAKAPPAVELTLPGTWVTLWTDHRKG